MFDIKGLRTFAMSAKDLNKAVEFYTKVLGGADHPAGRAHRGAAKSRPSERSRRSSGQFRSPPVRRVDKTSRSRPSSHADYSLARAREGFKGVKRHRRQHRESPAA